jgi:hypothetical protein
VTRAVRIRSTAAAVLAGALLVGACSGAPSTSGGPTGASGTTPASSATGATAEPSTPVASASPLIEDGKNFAFVKSVDTSTDPATVTYDLAYFLTGDAAAKAAREHGDETPPPNDYYIVNDNPKLRTVALAPGARVVLLDWNHCCDRTFDAPLRAFAEAIDGGTEMTSGGHIYKGQISPYWLVAEDGAIVRIQEQYLP